jgi:hypothetical protein
MTSSTGLAMLRYGARDLRSGSSAMGQSNKFRAKKSLLADLRLRNDKEVLMAFGRLLEELLIQ